MSESEDSQPNIIEEDSDRSSSVATPNLESCLKLTLPEHLAAYIEKQELNRDIEPIQCSEETIEKVCSNYVIIKNIISKLPWQDKLICKLVCTLWNSAVRTLLKEQLSPIDFSINLCLRAIRKGVIMKKSEEFYTEPMAIFTFCNTVALNVYTIGCEAIVPSPCTPACEKEHSILDMIYQQTSAPKNCMYAVKAYSVSYLPLPHSITYENVIRKPLRGSDAFFCGIYIPTIPGVEFKMINTKSSDDIRQELVAEIKNLSENYIVKGAVACLTDNYLLYADQENAECLEFLRGMQPDKPFAFGGCLIEDTANQLRDMEEVVDCVNKGKEFISGNLMSLGLFLTPKNQEPRCSFEVYSLVIEAPEWSKVKIQQAIQEFSQRVPRFEHSVALKLSCNGRHHKHEAEQHCFRTCFPNTRIVGCFGNGELGVNHPARSRPSPDAHKRAREEIPYEKVYSYSTVFVYICWGKMLAEAECDK